GRRYRSLALEFGARPAGSPATYGEGASARHRLPGGATASPCAIHSPGRSRASHGGGSGPGPRHRPHPPRTRIYSATDSALSAGRRGLNVQISLLSARSLGPIEKSPTG